MPIHLRGNIGDVAPYVLLPGDPNRAKYVAENFLEQPKLYTEHRGMLGYTGTYKGIPVSVQTTMMGCPSAAITVEELHMLGAKMVIRIGTCGGTSPDLKPADLVIAQAVLARDGTTRQYLGEGNHTPIADYRVVRALEQAAASVPHYVGLVASDDSFYGVSAEEARGLYTTRGVLGLEMEASAVFTVARLRGLEAGAIMAVSNYIGDESLVADEILKTGVRRMIQTALEAIIVLDKEKPLRLAS
ncbi:MAG: purine-nucleoside phosphorylase [Deinococcales bacterium]